MLALATIPISNPSFFSCQTKSVFFLKSIASDFVLISCFTIDKACRYYKKYQCLHNTYKGMKKLNVYHHLEFICVKCFD